MEKSKNNYPESDAYIKLDPSDALESKKNLLEVSASIIKMQMLNENIKKNGKNEVKQRHDARSEIKSMNLLLSHLMAELPRLKVQKSAIDELEAIQDPTMHHRHSKVEIKSKTVIPSRPKKATLNDELLEIRRKLETLK